MKILFKLFVLYLVTLSLTVISAESYFADELSAINVKTPASQYITAGQPSPNDLSTLAKSQVKVVINLRGEGEFDDFNEAETVKKLNMKYIHIPINGPADLTAENVAKFHQALQSTSLDHNEKVFIHCASSNRVGALFALEAFYYQNKSSEEAIQIGKNAGLASLENKVKTIILSEEK